MKTLFLSYSFLFGTFIGSFLNVIIYRLPREMDLVWKRSHCPQCKKQFKWYHNIPILSFLFLKAKCAYCKKNISWQYPIIEILTGLSSFFLFREYGLSFEYCFFFIISCLLACHFIIDLNFQILPDSINFLILVMVIAYSFFGLSFPMSWQSRFIGLFVGFGGTYFVTWVFYKIKGKIGLGGGDIKLFGIIGFLLGPLGITQNIFLSCMFGSIVMLSLIGLKKMRADQPIAFGPFIIIVFSLQIFLPEYFSQAMSLLLYK